jgi:hypothetical protein
MKYPLLALTACLFAAFLGMAESATAQMAAADVSNASCASYRDSAKNPAQRDLFMAYVQGYASAASPDPRYAPRVGAIADGVKRVDDWCKDNKQRAFGEAVANAFPRINGTAQGSVSSEPTYCSVGRTKFGCSGCSISCPPGKQATCKAGVGNADQSGCMFQASCACR